MDDAEKNQVAGSKGLSRFLDNQSSLTRCCDTHAVYLDSATPEEELLDFIITRAVSKNVPQKFEQLLIGGMATC